MMVLSRIVLQREKSFGFDKKKVDSFSNLSCWFYQKILNVLPLPTEAQHPSTQQSHLSLAKKIPSIVATLKYPILANASAASTDLTPLPQKQTTSSPTSGTSPTIKWKNTFDIAFKVSTTSVYRTWYTRSIEFICFSGGKRGGDIPDVDEVERGY
jgi:hypothetical protein